MFLQAFIVPVFAVILAAFARSYFPLVIAVAFWAISLWVKGITIAAMDSVAISISISALFIVILNRTKLTKILLVAIHAVLLILLSIWQVKNFASDIQTTAWLLQFSFIAIALGLSWWQRWKPVTGADSRLRRFQFDGLFWLIPVAYIAVLSPIAGSLMVGQMAGLITIFGLAVWVSQGWNKATVNDLSMIVATPTLFIGQMAWHYVEIPWTSLALGLIGWLPLLFPKFSNNNWLVKLILAAVLFGAILSLGLFLEWPEKSLY